MDLGGLDDSPSETISVEYKTNDVVMLMQMSYFPTEDYTYVTNLVVKISVKAINKRFNTEY
jgi:hypothetical protein